MRLLIICALATPFAAGVVHAQAEPARGTQVELSGPLTLDSSGAAKIGPVRLAFMGGLSLKDEQIGGADLKPDTVIVKGELRQEGGETVLRVEYIDLRTGTDRLQLQLKQGETQVRRDRKGRLQLVAWNEEALESGSPGFQRLKTELPREGDQGTYKVRGYLVMKGMGLGPVSVTPNRGIVVVGPVERQGEQEAAGSQGLVRNLELGR